MRRKRKKRNASTGWDAHAESLLLECKLALLPVMPDIDNYPTPFVDIEYVKPALQPNARQFGLHLSQSASQHALQSGALKMNVLTAPHSDSIFLAMRGVRGMRGNVSIAVIAADDFRPPLHVPWADPFELEAYCSSHSETYLLLTFSALTHETAEILAPQARWDALPIIGPRQLSHWIAELLDKTLTYQLTYDADNPERKGQKVVVLGDKRWLNRDWQKAFATCDCCGNRPYGEVGNTDDERTQCAQK